MPASKDEIRFWSKVQVGPGCHEWQAATDRNGHGVAWFDGRIVGAHRVAWELARGAAPNGALLHLCDNRRCVRVDHLREGSQAENVADMVAKGRQCAGEGKPNAKLDETAVRAIRIQFANGRKPADLARQFGVHRATVRDVVQGRRWKAVV